VDVERGMCSCKGLMLLCMHAYVHQCMSHV
jgi:hypothetical protein